MRKGIFAEGICYAMKPPAPEMSRRSFLQRSMALTALALAGQGPLWPSLSRARQPDSMDIAGPENPQIAIIIDDVGYSSSAVRPFFELGIPITFSILPRLRCSVRLAEKAHALGHEVMLHQPMEPHSRSIDPGPGALLLSHQADDLTSIIDANIVSIPFAVGVNNHMGSLFTESKKSTLETLGIFKERNFFFVDSYTSRHSIAFETARELNMTAACRNEFLDIRSERDCVLQQLMKLKKHALRFGKAIGIGHPKPGTVSALRDFGCELKGGALQLTYVSTIMAA